MIAFAPQPPPLPDPDDLTAQVNWLSYPHAELYRMVTEGLDLTGATDVSARWATLGEELDEIAGELAAAATAAEQAWQGEAADSARDGVRHLVQWARDTGIAATQVSGCVTREINNAVHARTAMPEPPAHPRELQPDTLTPSSFTGTDFGSVAAVGTDHTARLLAGQDAHRQAAQVMTDFQQNSREVYGTVPQFSSPFVRQYRTAPPVPPTVPPTQPPPQHQPRPDPAPLAAPAAGYRAAAPPTTGPDGPGRGPAEAAPTPRGTPAQPYPPAAAAAASSDPDGPAQQTGGARSGGGMMPGMGGGARGGEDHERKRAGYLAEDADLWNEGRPSVAPPVIGDSSGA